MTEYMDNHLEAVYEEYYEGDGGDYYPRDDPDYDLIDGVGFAQEGSALRAAAPGNPRMHPCPTCGRENVLTPIDVQRGYQCDHCADIAEGKAYGDPYV